MRLRTPAAPPRSSRSSAPRPSRSRGPRPSRAASGLLAAIGVALVALAPVDAAAQATGVAPLPFRREVIDASTRIGYGLAIADVDGDGRDDLLLADAREIAWYRSPDWRKSVIARELTAKDHVCIAAQDLDGDGRAEIAVGAGWNPGDTVGSGAIFLLERPADPTQPWTPHVLPHEPTTHRMHWIDDGRGAPLLAVLPLHGRGNRDGAGAGVRFLGYRWSPRGPAAIAAEEIDATLHLTHNFEPPVRGSGTPELLVAAKEGVHALRPSGNGWSRQRLTSQPAGEVRRGRAADGSAFITTIEPMHGHEVVVYSGSPEEARVVLDASLVQGHGLATGDLLGRGSDQVIAGWRGNPVGPATVVGIRLYAATDPAGTRWEQIGVLDDNAVACEDLRVADLDRDGDLDVVAAGRATRNVVIYWNERTPPRRGRRRHGRSSRAALPSAKIPAHSTGAPFPASPSTPRRPSCIPTTLLAS
ncbi:MAG: VCBS repeat-containing protein [Verrucomicrobia bacterium]|nr:VCBS repeat-containing protein [Verrucomicrobiota bacterium]